jgi:hypothetical protein
MKLSALKSSLPTLSENLLKVILSVGDTLFSHPSAIKVFGTIILPRLSDNFEIDFPISEFAKIWIYN